MGIFFFYVSVVEWGAPISCNWAQSFIAPITRGPSTTSKQHRDLPVSLFVLQIPRNSPVKRDILRNEESSTVLATFCLRVFLSHPWWTSMVSHRGEAGGQILPPGSWWTVAGHWGPSCTAGAFCRWVDEWDHDRWGRMDRLLVGGLVAIFYFPIYWVANHPNWLIFFRGVQTTNQDRWNMMKCIFSSRQDRDWRVFFFDWAIVWLNWSDR